MKLKLDSKSIKFKTWLYFIIFAVAIMCLLWVLQVLFLNTFYGTMKTEQTREVREDIEDRYKSSDTDEFINQLYADSRAYDMYIYLVSSDRKITYFAPSVEDSSLQYSKQIPVINDYMAKHNLTQANMRLHTDTPGKDLIAYCTLLENKSRDPMIVYLFSPLWPVASTMQILITQLIYVTIISLLLACLISFYLSNRITRPIRKINASAQKLAGGQYGVVFQGGHYTEIDQLADTLTAASIELEKSEKIQNDLMANVSHDLRTPLTMIRSYAEMIQDISGDDPVKRNEHLQVIMDESDRLNNLVEDLLAISRLQSGKMTIEKTEFNLTHAVESIVNTYRVMELEDNYTFNLESPADFIVRADEEKIKQVVSNFITNAIKFCGEDKTVNVSLKRKGRAVECRIEDHGCGIAPEELDHIWERYYRASDNMVRAKEGSGLGLSICKEILTLHKVRFGVDSTVGKGTSFWFQTEFVRAEKKS